MPVLLFWRPMNSDPPLYSPYHSRDVATAAQAVNRSSVAALAFLVWDILITTDDEVKLIWPRTWSYTKYVYFIARYIPLFVQISILLVGSELTPHFHFTPNDCYIWKIYQGVVAAFILLTVDTILILRVRALYHDHRNIRRLVAALYFLEIAGTVIGLVFSLPGITSDDICVIVDVPRTLIIWGASLIIFQFFLFGLTLYKFIQAVHSGWGCIPPVVLLMRDGTWAFFLVFLIYVGGIALFAFHNHAFYKILYGWGMTTYSFCGYRILHNLNRLSQNTVGGSEGDGYSTRHAVHSDIRFSIRIFDPQRRETTCGPEQEDSSLTS